MKKLLNVLLLLLTICLCAMVVMQTREVGEEVSENRNLATASNVDDGTMSDESAEADASLNDGSESIAQANPDIPDKDAGKQNQVARTGSALIQSDVAKTNNSLRVVTHHVSNTNQEKNASYSEENEPNAIEAIDHTEKVDSPKVSDARDALIDTLAQIGRPALPSEKKDEKAKVAELKITHAARIQSKPSKSVEPANTTAKTSKLEIETSSNKTVDSLQRLGMSMRPGRDSITIGKVVTDGAAYRAGLRAGDTIVSVNREPVFDTDGFSTVASGFEAGQPFRVFVVRSHEWCSFQVTLPAKTAEATKIDKP